MRYRVAICAMYKNEAPFMGEWIEYHRFIGVEHFYLYNNNSDDNHEEVLQPYIQRGIVTKHDYDVDLTNMTLPDARKDDKYPYNDCIHRHKDEAEWIAFIDLDEFIHLYQDKTIGDMMKRYTDYGGLAINWLTFGTSGHYLNPVGSVLANYTLRSSCYSYVNSYIKSIINPRVWVRWPNTHAPVLTKPLVYSDFTPCRTLCGRHFDFSVCSLHHYFAKSKQYYLYTKVARVIDINILQTPTFNTHYVQPGTFAARYYADLGRWEAYNDLSRNCIEDTSLADMLPYFQHNIPNFVGVTQHLYLDKSYLNHNNAKQYYDANIGLFKQHGMSTVFHHWFIFAKSEPRSYLIPPEDDSFFARYNNKDFIDFLAKYQSSDISKEPITFSPKVAREFYYAYEYWLPDDVSSLIDRTELNIGNRYDAILHWLTKGTLPPPREPTAEPTTEKPTTEPTTAKPTAKPVGKPTAKPTAKPVGKPTEKPTAKPVGKPTEKSVGKPIAVKPPGKPTAKPKPTAKS